MRNTVLFFCLMLLATGCATRFFIPASRFILPESSGALWKGDIKIGSAGVTQVQLADDATSVNPDLTPVLSRNSDFYLGADLGLARFLDIYYNFTSSAPNAFGVKIQLLGEPASSAKSGNFSFSIAGGPTFGSIKQSTEIAGIKGESQMKFSGWDATVLLGYRAADNFLIYTGPFKTYLKTDTTIKRTENNVAVTTAEPNGSGEVTGINLGFRWGQSLYLNVEGSYLQAKWTRSHPIELKAEDLSGAVGGIAVGGAW